MNPLVVIHDIRRFTTVTDDDRIFETRKAYLAYAEQVGNVSEARTCPNAIT